MLPNSWFKKEKPLIGLLGMWGGVGSTLAGGGDAPGIEASGGFVGDAEDPEGIIYRYHVWHENGDRVGDFVVSDLGSGDGTVEYIAIGAGGCGGGSRGGGGGAGGVQCNLPGLDPTIHPSAPTPAITVGVSTSTIKVGNGSWRFPDGFNGQGEPSVITFPTSTITALGGAQGGTYNANNPFDRNKGGGGPTYGCGAGGGGVAGPSPGGSPEPAPTGGQGYGGGPLGGTGPNCVNFQYLGTGGGGVGAAGTSGNQRKNYAPWPNPYGDGCPGPPSRPGGFPGGSVGPGVSPYPFYGGNILGMGAVGGEGAYVTSIDIDNTQLLTPGPSPGLWFGGGGAGGNNDGYYPGSPTTHPKGEPNSDPVNPARWHKGGAGGGGQGSCGSGGGPYPGTGAAGPTSPYGTDRAKGRGDNWFKFPNGNPNLDGYSYGGQSGTFMTGGGGGGGGYETGGSTGGHGGPGMVLIRYAISAAQSGTKKATGGLVSFFENPGSPTGKTCIHTFLQDGTFTTDAGFSETVEYVVIAGGGQGGKANSWKQVGGGGGAGGYRTGTTPFTTPTAVGMAVTVGKGGDGPSGGKKWFYGPDNPTEDVGSIKGANTCPGQPSGVVFPTVTVTSDGGGAGGCPTTGEPYPTWPGPAQFASFPGPSKGWWSWWGSPGGSGGGVSGNRNNSSDYQTFGKGNYFVDNLDAPFPGQGNDGGGNPYPFGGYEDLGLGGGGGGAGSAGTGVPPGPSSPPGRPAPQRVSGAAGAGVQLPTTFRNPLQVFAPGPGGNWYVAGGGEAGYFTEGEGAAPGGPYSETTPGGRSPAGGGKANNWMCWEGMGGPGSPSPSGIVGIGSFTSNPDSMGANGTGGGGGGGVTFGPTTYSRTYGARGGSGIVMIAYPA